VGIGNVLEGQVLEPFERGFYVGLAGAYALEKFCEVVGIHGGEHSFFNRL
jgi:hypothetical protein